MNLNDLRLAKGVFTDAVYAGEFTNDGNSSWLNKVDVTGDFLTAAIARWNGCEEVITSRDGRKYKIRITEIE